MKLNDHNKMTYLIELMAETLGWNERLIIDALMSKDLITKQDGEQLKDAFL